VGLTTCNIFRNYRVGGIGRLDKLTHAQLTMRTNFIVYRTAYLNPTHNSLTHRTRLCAADASPHKDS